MQRVRKEKDFLGEVGVPAKAYYGAQTVRAVENFPISGRTASSIFVEATAIVKKAAALANMETGSLKKKTGRAIVRAADEIISGKLHEQFVVDVFQAGAGTSHNMNANEVIANRAIELLGGKKGNYSLVHPNDHVNMGQSTNDVIPSAIRVAALLSMKEFLPELEALSKAFGKKAKSFDKIIKSGRTHLQDAAPLTLGQEFSGYAEALRSAHRTIQEQSRPLAKSGLGGSAVGTGLNTHAKYRKLAVKHMAKIAGIAMAPADNLFEAMQSMAPFVGLSGALKGLALELIRIANDLRLLSSGPTTGFGEIELPAVQPGSSIMPGKVNPVIAEATNMVCFHVLGNDLAISMAAQAGQCELNVMMPLIAFELLDSIEVLKNMMRVLRTKCVAGIAANRKRCEEYAARTMALATALNPIIGYHKAAEVARESLARGVPIRDIVLEKGYLSEKELNKILLPQRMTRPSR